MSNAFPSVPLLLADPDAHARAEVAACFRDEGWTVAEAADRAACLAGFASAPGAVLVAHEMADGDPATWFRELVSEAPRGTRFLLSFEPTMELDWEGLASAGIDEFLERPLRPGLVRHRLGRMAPSAGPSAGPSESTGCWMEPDAFLGCLSETLLTASSDESKVAVISAVLEVPGQSLTSMDAHAERAWNERLTRQAHAAFEADEDGSLASLLPGLRLCRPQPGVMLMMIPGVTRLQESARIGARLQEQLSQPMEQGGRMVEPQVGLGISAFPEDGREAVQLAANAQEAARRARREGSSLMIFHTEAMGRWAFERLTLERSLREAISREELRVYYQPRVDTETRRIKGMECLVRWQHPELGLVPPGQFIPLAEETGLIVPIGEWVLREACRQNQAWREAGLPKIAMSVNLSPVQFRRTDLYAVVMDALAESGLENSGLELEVTESMLMNDPKKTCETLQRIKSAGIHISIDDFGTGYSSLSYLKRFPIDALKIDRSFVMDVTTNPDDAAIATAIILMGHSLKLSVVAEGVETESQLEFLRVLQCNEIQGFLFSPPVPADKAEVLLRMETFPRSIAA